MPPYQYHGKVNVTATGKACRQWSLQTQYEAKLFPEGSLVAASNYCRDPSRSLYPWCYIDEINWGHCIIDLCGK